MPFPTTVKNKLLDNVFKGILWDTPGFGASFGNMCIRASTTTINPDGSGFTQISSPSAPFWAPSSFTSASGGSASLNFSGAIAPTSGSGRGTIRALAIFESTFATQAYMRAFYNLPVAREHQTGDSLGIANGTVTFSLT